MGHHGETKEHNTMDMTLAIVLAATGFGLLLFSIFFDGLLDIAVLDTPYLSGTVIGAFLAGYGLMGMALPEGWGFVVWLVALLPALAMAAVAVKLTQWLNGAPRPPSINAAALLGATGVVVSPVFSGAFGEVNLNVAGHLVKYNAKSDQDLPAGTPVHVLDSLSPTSVLVARS